jgi:hypothetical protein
LRPESRVEENQFLGALDTENAAQPELDTSILSLEFARRASPRSMQRQQSILAFEGTHRLSLLMLTVFALEAQADPVIPSELTS